VTNASLATVALVRTKEGTFILSKDSAGFTVGARATTLGFRPVEIAALELRDVKADADALLANVTAVQNTTVGRLAMAAIALGIAQAAFEHARGYADVREQFNEKLRNFEGVQFKLADMVTHIEAARTLLQKAAAEPTASLSAMAKLFASECAMWVTTQAVQIYGGYGYMRDYPVEKLMRDAKATELMEGVNEIQRVTIARELYEGDK
jgi:alkylation response protein AidB-like acyl-CoA dehydrogenase